MRLTKERKEEIRSWRNDDLILVLVAKELLAEIDALWADNIELKKDIAAVMADKLSKTPIEAAEFINGYHAALKERDQLKAENDELKRTEGSSILVQEIWKLRAENEKIKNDYSKLASDSLANCKHVEEKHKENEKLRSRIEKLREALINRTKRSFYTWSPGGHYRPCDYENEGSITCAHEALARDDEEAKDETEETA